MTLTKVVYASPTIIEGEINDVIQDLYCDKKHDISIEDVKISNYFKEGYYNYDTKKSETIHEVCALIIYEKIER